MTLGLVALVGGVLGVIFMVPLRQALIVEEHGVLPFPEGTACAEVLLAGEEGGSKAGVVFSGLGLAAFYKFVSDGLKIFPSEIGHDIAFYKGSSIGIQVLPALAGVGYICGPKISSFMFAGGTLSWFVIMPLIALFGGDAVVFPGTDPISTLAPSDLWGTYVKYIGAGAVATGGIISLIKSFPLIVRTFKQAMQGMKSAGKASALRTEQDIPMPVLLVEGIMNAQLPWALILTGVGVAIVAEIVGIQVMPFAVGMYLPFSLSAGIMAGGVVRWFMERRKNVSEEERRAGVDRGVLYTSGLIAGEGLMGVILAGVAAAKLNIDCSGIVNLGSIGSIVLFLALLGSLAYVCMGGKKKA